MARLSFTANLRQHVFCPEMEAAGATVREVLEVAFAQNPRLRGYVLDDQNRLRKHMVIFVGGQQIQDRERLTDVVEPESDVVVMQALSGG